MPEVNWKYAQNQFLSSTERRRPQMLIIGADHTAKLVARLGSPPDAEIQACIDRAQPLFDVFQQKMITYDVVSGSRKGKTSALDVLLVELARQRARQWDVTVQTVYLAGTPEYDEIFPDGRTALTRGKIDVRILAVETLAQRLGEFGEFSTLQTSVETFYSTIKTARDTQQGKEGDIQSASEQAEAARVALAIGLFGNVGQLMIKHAAEPWKIEEYFELALLRSGGGGSSVPPEGGGGETELVEIPANWQQVGPDAQVWFQMIEGLEGVVDVMITEGGQVKIANVNLEPGQSQLVVWEGTTIEGDVDEIVLRNANGDAVARGVRDESLPNPGV